MNLHLFSKPKTPTQKKPQPHQDSLPIFRHTRLLVGVLIVILLLLVGVFLIAGHSYRRYHSDTSALLLFGVLMVIVVVMAPLFWGSQIGLVFGPNGLQVGNGVTGTRKIEEAHNRLPPKKTTTRNKSRRPTIIKKSTKQSDHTNTKIQP